MNEAFAMKYELTLPDLIKYNTYCVHHVPELRRNKIRSRIVGASALGLFVLLAWLFRGNPYLLIVLGAISSLVSVIFLNHLLFLDYSIRKQVEKGVKKGMYQGVLAPRRLEIGQDSYTVYTDDSETKRFWTAIQRTVQTHHYLYLFVNASCAEIVPRHAFENDAQWTHFVEKVGSIVPGGIILHHS